MPAVQLLESFRSSHKHVALVMDEYGAVEGLVTVTDLLTAIVGDLPADASEAEGAFVSRADGSWLVDGSAAMEEVTTHFGMDSLPEDEAGAYHTIGGFVMARLGRVPKTADTFEWGGMRFEVMDMDGRRIDKVLVTRKHAPQRRQRADHVSSAFLNCSQRLQLLIRRTSEFQLARLLGLRIRGRRALRAAADSRS